MSAITGKTIGFGSPAARARRPLGDVAACDRSERRGQPRPASLLDVHVGVYRLSQGGNGAAPTTLDVAPSVVGTGSVRERRSRRTKNIDGFCHRGQGDLCRAAGGGAAGSDRRRQRERRRVARRCAGTLGSLSALHVPISVGSTARARGRAAGTFEVVAPPLRLDRAMPRRALADRPHARGDPAPRRESRPQPRAEHHRLRDPRPRRRRSAAAAHVGRCRAGALGRHAPRRAVRTDDRKTAPPRSRTARRRDGHNQPC